MSGRPFIADRHTAMIAGFGLVVLGSALIWDAYEHRGRTRPFFMRLVTVA